MRWKRLRCRYAWRDPQPGCFPWLRMLRGKGLLDIHCDYCSGFFVIINIKLDRLCCKCMLWLWRVSNFNKWQLPGYQHFPFMMSCEEDVFKQDDLMCLMFSATNIWYHILNDLRCVMFSLRCDFSWMMVSPKDVWCAPPPPRVDLRCFWQLPLSKEGFHSPKCVSPRDYITWSTPKRLKLCKHIFSLINETWIR